jgi:Ca2+-dependent lipid-binding protein
LIKATDIPRIDQLSQLDPYCTVELEGADEVYETGFVGDDQNPEWNQEFEFTFEDEAVLTVTLWDRYDGDDGDDDLKLAVLEVPLVKESVMSWKCIQ